MKTKMALEDSFYAIASASGTSRLALELKIIGEPCVLICDRGTMDTAAYLPQGTLLFYSYLLESWEVLLDEYGWNLMNIRDRRYAFMRWKRY